MAQAVSCRPLTAETYTHAQVNPRAICGGQTGNGTGSSVSPSILFRRASPHSYIMWGMNL
jgi:hypothetical protein